MLIIHLIFLFPNNIFIECKDPIETTLLNGIVNENIIQFLNADDTQSAIQLFDSRQKKNESNIIDIVINKYNTDIHNLEGKYRFYKKYEILYE
jgi:hypothetical protein